MPKRSRSVPSLAQQREQHEEGEPTTTTVGIPSRTAGNGDAPSDAIPVAYEGLTQYEIERAKLIARNRARMLALGIPVALETLSKLTARPATAPAPHHHKPRPAASVPEAPTRRSTRLQGQPAEGEGLNKEEGEQGKEEVDEELGQFIVTGECPRCGRLFTRGHRAHLDRCAGLPAAEPIHLTDEEIREQAEALRRTENAKLAALELEGLIDLTPEAALFLVLGSTGNHYTVTLSDAKRKCQCPDHRIRHRDCKHIRLILTNLGVLDHPQDWRQAVNAKFLKHGAGQEPAEGAQHSGDGSAAAPGADAASEGRNRRKGNKGGQRARGPRGKKAEAAGGE